MNTTAMRSRWAAIGAAVAVVLGAGSIGLVSATNPSDATAYVPTEPCRIADTRPAFLKGPKATPLAAGETHTIGVSDAGTDCNAATFAGASALQLNVTAIGATAPTFFTFWATGTPQPNASSLNPAPGQPPTPNAVTVSVNGDGKFNVFNLAGSVNVAIDIVGFYTDHNHDDRYYQKSETYTKAEVDGAIAPKANSADVYTKTEVDSKTWSSTSLTNEPGKSDNFVDGLFDLGDNTTDDPVLVIGTGMRVPSDGWILVNYSGKFRGLDIDDSAFCQVQLNEAVAVDQAEPHIRLDDGAGTNHFSGHRMMPISASDNPLLFNFGQNINLVCENAVPSEEIDIIDPHISAVFIPTSYEPFTIVLPPIFPLEEPPSPDVVTD